MNPLSALPSVAGPSVARLPAMQNPAELGAAKAIPFSDLEKLSPGILPLPSVSPTSSTAGMGNLVTDLVSGVAQKQAVAADSVNGLLAGRNVSLHQTMIAMEEASISFQLMVEVRNKMLESYQELMRMQV